MPLNSSLENNWFCYVNFMSTTKTKSPTKHPVPPTFPKVRYLLRAIAKGLRAPSCTRFLCPVPACRTELWHRSGLAESRRRHTSSLGVGGKGKTGTFLPAFLAFISYLMLLLDSGASSWGNVLFTDRGGCFWNPVSPTTLLAAHVSDQPQLTTSAWASRSQWKGDRYSFSPFSGVTATGTGTFKLFNFQQVVSQAGL